MNYQKIYNDICKRGQERILEKGIYFERHHIIPRCLGGCDAVDNLSKLTAREHYIVHRLLTEIYPKHKGIIYAFWIMCSKHAKNQKRYIPSSKSYEYAKQKYVESLKGTKFSEERKQKISASAKTRTGKNHPRYGIKVSDETKKRMSKSAKNRPMPFISKESHAAGGLKRRGKSVSEETRQKIRIARKLQICTEETRIKLSLARRGKKFSEEHKRNLSISRQNRPAFDVKTKEEISKKIRLAYESRPTIVCPFCQKQSKNIANMQRYHFDKCKFAGLVVPWSGTALQTVP